MTGLTQSGTGCFIVYPYGNSGRQRVLNEVLVGASNEDGMHCKSTYTLEPHCTIQCLRLSLW